MYRRRESLSCRSAIRLNDGYFMNMNGKSMMNTAYDAIEIYWNTPEIGFNGCLGHRARSVSVPPKLADWVTLGAHVDDRHTSSIDLYIRRPIELCGVLSGSASDTFEPGELQFVLDGTVIGEGHQVWSTTDRLVVLPGRHRLEIRVNSLIALRNKLRQHYGRRVTDVTDRSKEYADCAWTFREFDGVPATVDNTVFLTSAAYADVDESMRLFLDSAKRYGVPITPYDVGREWVSFYEHKIHGFLRELHKVRESGKKYAFSLDSRVAGHRLHPSGRHPSRQIQRDVFRQGHNRLGCLRRHASVFPGVALAGVTKKNGLALRRNQQRRDCR